MPSGFTASYSSGASNSFTITNTHTDVADPHDTGASDWLNTDDHILFLVGYPDGSFGPGRSMT